MRAVAVVPVKRFDRAKQRLSAGLSEEERRTLTARLVEGALHEIATARSLDAVLVVTGDAEAAEIATALGLEAIDDAGAPGHSEAALLGIAVARERGAECVALLPGDCPEIRAVEIDDLLGSLESPGVAIIPDHHGTGTNGLVLAPPDAIAPSFGEGSCARHARLAEEAGVPHSVVALPSLALDIDTPEDLALWQGV